MIIGLCRERTPGETRVALTPPNIKTLVEKNHRCLVEAGAGDAAGFPDDSFREAGAEIVDSQDSIYQQSDLILGVTPFSADEAARKEEVSRLRSGQMISGMLDPLGTPQLAQELAAQGVTALSLELVPRISRAQSMDVLSSMATLAGYHAVLRGASLAPRILPLMMTAAGTLQPAKVMILGAGVAGLQACATAKRLGAVVSAYDIRPAARDQIISVGATPVDLELETEESETAGGYAKEQSADQLAKQQAALAKVLAEQDIVITTAAVPGRRSPVLITEEMLKSMRPGSVIVDIACERGGNCAKTQGGKTLNENGVIIDGPLNLPARHAFHASQMFGNNITTMLTSLMDDDGVLQLDFNDEIVAGTVISHEGEVPQAMVREILGLPALAKEETPEQTEAAS
ncbi:MAG: Re/Si-specific NAD(P)(+) transhydrogenase subunit alpha [Oceanisphaera sp.]|nr:Re/Si-specific NAD(P)(+) transhydrogenase subunit alpha [Oceanisphaera sp.]